MQVKRSNGIVVFCTGIMAVEAYHGGVIRTFLYQAHDTMTPYNIPLDDAVQKLALLRGKLGAGNGHGIVNDTASSMGEQVILVADDSQGLAYQRNPQQASVEIWLAL